MNSIKVYENVNKLHDDINFGISTMSDIYNKRKGKIDSPHRHNYYTVLIIKEASGSHNIDFNVYPLENNQVYFVAPGQVHQVIEKKQSKGYSIVFSTQFLIENNIPLAFINSLNLFNNYDQNPPLYPDKSQFEEIYRYANQIYDLSQSDAKMKFLSIGAFLKLLLIECNNICSLSSVDMDDVKNLRLQEFKDLVDEFYKCEHSTNFYADKMHITPDHLNRIVRPKIGKTAKEYIQARIVTEAKRLLFFTDLNSKEVAYELGFEEPANFSNFFKKHTNNSPSNFRKREILF